uniref:N-acetyltransferase n=1 Tax=Pedobacter schmidteae TaxID=2201271 RepID=UPI000EAB4F34|nr:N-acetyltransferase [Pedobacter schmidteae]
MKVITKFTVGTEQGIEALMFLAKAILSEKLSNLLNADELDRHLEAHYSKNKLIAELNSMSNQWLVVYADDQPVGYACITSNGKRPEVQGLQRMMRIADFGILKKFSNDAIKQSLFDKCLAVCRPYEAIWINEYSENPLLGFFQDKGFVKREGRFQLDELPMASVLLVKKQNP